MDAVLGLFTWQDIIKYQDQDIELKFIGDTKKYPKPKTMQEFQDQAGRRGRIKALKIHLPYIKEHYKSVEFDELALKIIEHEFAG